MALGVALDGWLGQFDCAILDTNEYMVCIRVGLKQKLMLILDMLDEIKVTACLGGTVMRWLCVITRLFFIIVNEFAIGFKGSAGAWSHDYSCSAVRWVRPIHYGRF